MQNMKNQCSSLAANKMANLNAIHNELFKNDNSLKARADFYVFGEAG